MAVLSTYLGRVFDALDVLLNALVYPGARLKQTISVHAALDRRKGKRVGCILCAILGVLVQPRHCDQALTQAPMPAGAAVRAALLLAAIWSLIGWGVSIICHHL
jgi:hypothetical protein